MRQAIAIQIGLAPILDPAGEIFDRGRQSGHEPRAGFCRVGRKREFPRGEFSRSAPFRQGFLVSAPQCGITDGSVYGFSEKLSQKKSGKPQSRGDDARRLGQMGDILRRRPTASQGTKKRLVIEPGPELIRPGMDPAEIANNLFPTMGSEFPVVVHAIP